MNASGRHSNSFIYAIILSLLLTGCAAGPEAMPPPGEPEVPVAESPAEAGKLEEGIGLPAGPEGDAEAGAAQKSPETRPTTEAGESDQADATPAARVPADPARPMEQEPLRTESDGAVAPAPATGDPEQPAAGPLTVMMAIHGLAGTPAILPAQPVPWEPGDTVLDLLIRVTRERRIHMAHRGRGRTGYVEGIDNLYEFDHGPASGWVYSINGVFPDRSAGGREAEPGDEIAWWYTLDAGRDVQAVSP